MAKKNSYLTFTDQFCGAGGSSSGVRNMAQKLGSGIEVKIALNHWKLAIETHETNFPDTFHDCTDISASDPRRYHSTDVLITSPECTNHSLAKGKKIIKKQLDLYEKAILDPAAERSRATMWDVPRFAEYHNYNAIVVENVVDARKWIMFDAWLMAMHALNYNHKCVYLNSMHCHPTPQSRDRMYIVFWKKGNKAPDLDYKPLGYCHKCEKDVNALQSFKRNQKSFRYKTGYIYTCPLCTTAVEPYYYASFNCIDWSDIGTKISERGKLLSPITRERIQYGLDKYSGYPFNILNYTPGYSKKISDTFGTITKQDHHGLVSPFPFIINDQHSTGIDHRVRGVDDKLPVVTSEPHFKFVVPPFIIKEEHKESFSNTRTFLDTLQTQTVRQSMGLICPPFLVNNKGQSKSTQITDAANTQTNNAHLGIISNESWNAFICSYYGNSFCTKHITHETGAVTTNTRLALAVYKKPLVDECYYRMLNRHEVKLAMAFDKDYVVLGSGKDQVKQLGNAVTPPAMEYLSGQVVKTFM